MKITFIRESDYESKVVHEFEAHNHYEITRYYVDFLRGCGFILPKERGESSFDIADLLKPPK